MSLTSHLDDKSSPVRAHIAATFPHVRDARFADTDDPSTTVTVDGQPLQLSSVRRFTAGPPVVLPPPGAESYPWGTAGTAFDHRLRLLLTPADTGVAPSSPAAVGARLLGPGGRGWKQTVAALDAVAPSAGSAPAEPELSRLCGVLALYEQLYRMGPSSPGWDRSALVAAGPDIDLDVLYGLLDPRLPADVAAMAALAARQPGLLGARNVVAGPTFARSHDLGGADADLLFGGLLLEVKAVQNAALSQLLLWQVLGYLLADTDDTHRISRVGFYFARHGAWWEMPVPEFLRRLAGRDVDLAQERGRFTQTCGPRRRPTGTVRPDGRGDRGGVLTPARIARGEAAGFGAGRGRDEPAGRALSFCPSARRAGMWHTPVAQVPWVASTRPPGADLGVPACGAMVTLDLAAKPRTARPGQVRSEVGRRVCGHCWTYTAVFYATPFDPDAAPRLADLPYYPARGRPSGRWHARAGDTGYVVTGSADGPACAAPGVLDLDADPLRPPAGGVATDANPRMCRRCLAISPRPDPAAN